jgi:hypothetical protein
VIFHPGILALVSGSILVTLMMLYAAMLGVRVILHWDFASSSASQLSLERKTYLISTIMTYVLGFQIISALLFLYTADDIYRLFVGAMCATGSLNANPVGWTALFSKVIVCYLAGLWLVLNYLDQKAEDYPLVKLKYGLLIALLPLIVLDSLLQFYYFFGLDPDIITSCCGSLFSDAGTGAASSLAGLPVLPTMTAFYATSALIFTVSLFCLWSQKSFWRYLLAIFNAAFFFIALAAVVSFISMYIYELPTHHCPFDIMQKEYGFIGYPLYTSLFCGIFFGLLPGMFQPAMTIPSLQGIVNRLTRVWIIISVSFIAVFVLMTTYYISSSNLIYFPS